MDIEILYKKIGTYDEKLDCLYTGYLVYPDIPIYEIKQDKDYFIPLIEKHFFKVDDLKKGDLLILQFYNGFHFGIYAENDKFFHCCSKHKLRLSELRKYKKNLVGIYRCQK
jgi:cell wall-associated NlpC family hydrolase